MPFINTDMCFMFLSKLFHLYLVDNEVQMGESRSSKRKTHPTFRNHNMFVFSQSVPSEARAQSGKRPNVKESALVPTRRIAPRFVHINTDFRALDE